MSGNDRIRIQAVQSNQAIRRVAPVGARLPLYVGASSKVLLAYAAPEQQSAVLTAEDWPESIDRYSYMEHLAEVKRQGYAISIEEREPGAAAVSVPIFGRDQQLSAALSVSGPVNRMSVDKMQEYIPHMQAAAERMETMLRTVT